VINESGGTFDIWFSNDGVNKFVVNDVAAQFELTYVLNAKKDTEYNICQGVLFIFIKRV
jgi:hypothetical protein